MYLYEDTYIDRTSLEVRDIYIYILIYIYYIYIRKFVTRVLVTAYVRLLRRGLKLLLYEALSYYCMRP
jgi:hypothetical protein